MRVRELVEEARLTHAGLTDDRGDLPATAASELLGAAKLLKLGTATDELSQPSPSGRLQTGARRTGPHNFVDLDGFAQPLDVDGAERLDLDEPLGESERVG